VSIRKKASGKYEARYYDPRGRLRGKSFATKTAARQFLAEIETDKRRGEWVDPRSGQVRFRDFAEDWLATIADRKPSTRARYESLLRVWITPHFGDLRLSSIERVQIQAWLAQLRATGVGSGTVRNAFRVLSSVLAEAAHSKLIAANPATGFKLPAPRREEMRFLTPSEIRRLADAIEPPFRALVLMAGFTGLRWGELAALHREHLDLLRGSVDVRYSVSEVNGHIEEVGTKTGERRTVPLPKFLCDILLDHLGHFSSPDGLVFTSPEGGPLRRQNFYSRHFKPALGRSGLDPLRFHDLRHSAASIAINRGANVLQVQNMLGHSSATVTLDTYSHVYPALAEQLREDLDAAYRESDITSRDNRSTAVANIWRAR
jgi:integrase